MEKAICGWWRKMISMSSMCIGICLMVCLGAGVIVYHERNEQRRLLMLLDQMLEEAMRGEGIADRYDESQLSAIEAKMFQYLLGHENSAKILQEEKDQIKTLISDISHQTKTPIANISLYAQLLAEKETDEQYKAYSELLVRQADKLQFLIDALVKSSRLEAGIITLHTKKQSILPLIENVILSARSKVEEKKMTIAVDVPKEEIREDITAAFDLKWTIEALYNIVDNAIKYSPEQTKIVMAVRCYELFVCIDVIDQGMGISEEEIPQIFSRFYRGAKTYEIEGVGIGLYLARQIISNEGGYIKVQSKPNEGTSFSIFLLKQ